MICTSKLVRVALVLLVSLAAPDAGAQETDASQDLDARVQQFLDEHRNQWHDANVPSADGQLLYDLVRSNGYTQALEIGTSTGHSAIWIAWALSKTGGKLVTIEIDESRYLQALDSFEAAGLSDYIDARLADAHDLVLELEGPFDFVFLDADKEWYTRYFEAIFPKLEVGGCFTAHNVSGRRMRGIDAFMEKLESTANLETEIVRASHSGMSVSYKK